MGKIIACFYVVFIILLLIFAVDYNSFAEGTSKGSSFMDFPVGSRPIAMQNGFVAMADDTNAIFYNPAGLCNLNSSMLGFGYTLLPNEFYEASGGMVLSRGYEGLWAFGIGGRYITKKPMDSYTVTPVIDSNNKITYSDVQKGDKIEPKQGVGYISIGKASSDESLFFGINIKGIYDKIDDKAGYGSSLDVGLIYHLYVDIALMMQDIVGGIQYPDRKIVPIDRKLKLGFGLSIPNNPFKVALEFDKNLNNDKNIDVILSAKLRIWSSKTEGDKIKSAISSAYDKNQKPKLQDYATPKLKTETKKGSELYLNTGVGNGFGLGFTFMFYNFGLSYGTSFPNGDRKDFIHSASLEFVF